MGKSVVLIHGAWLTPASWGNFQGRFSRRGYDVIAPAWPHEDMPLSALRRSPPESLKRTGIAEIVDHYDRFIRPMSPPPAVVGHSFGGLFTQLLLDRGLGSAGVAIDAVPIKGAIRGIAAVRSALPVLLSRDGWRGIRSMSFPAFFTRFANGMTEADARYAYEKYVAPTPGKLFLDKVLNRGNEVDPLRRTVPLLLTAGGRDRTVPAAAVRKVYALQKASPAITALKSFPDRSHFLCSMPGWEEVADFILDWLDEPRAGEL